MRTTARRWRWSPGARDNRAILSKLDLCATEATGARLEEEIGLLATRLKSGPMGGDQQVGAKIAAGELNGVIFLWDPLLPHPHDVDLKALLRIAVVYDVPLACNLASASLMSVAFDDRAE